MALTFFPLWASTWPGVWLAVGFCACCRKGGQYPWCSELHFIWVGITLMDSAPRTAGVMAAVSSFPSQQKYLWNNLETAHILLDLKWSYGTETLWPLQNQISILSPWAYRSKVTCVNSICWYIRVSEICYTRLLPLLYQYFDSFSKTQQYFSVTCNLFCIFKKILHILKD